MAKTTTTENGTEGATVADGYAQKPVFYQVSTLNALMMGNFDGVVTVGELKRHGSWGIGTYEGLDGEAIVCDGHAYDAHADGTTCEYSDDARKAFDDNDNAWVMMAMHGTFTSLRVRSCEKQLTKPYPTLSEVASSQHEHSYENESGWVIGAWVPAYLEGINLPGWHIHFLSDDTRRGGHLLELAVGKASGKLESYARFEMDLPVNREFDKLDLGEDLASATASVEG